MAIFPLPDNNFRNARPRLHTPAQVNRSGWTGARQVMGLAGGGFMAFKSEHVTIQGERRMEEWRAFFADLEGPVHKFRLPVTETEQVSADIACTARAGTTVNSVPVTVSGPSRTVLRRGQFATVADQPVILSAPLVTDEQGRGELRFKQFLRRAPAVGAAVVIHRPTALVAMVDDMIEWEVEPGQSYGFSIDVAEAF